ncbi:MAG: serine protein kinase RIO [archaeon]|nr:serine protein kinase RIO [archaeon]
MKDKEKNLQNSLRKEQLAELKEIIKFEAERKTFARVFNYETVMAVHSLAKKGYFKELEFVISTGKEAEVFRAVDEAGNFRAVKIYKINTSNFSHMIDYIRGDERFAKVQKDKREVVFAWTKKEFNNLEKARKAKVRVPLPIAFTKNVLIMEFIGENGNAARTLRTEKNVDLIEAYFTIINAMANLYKANLVHSDLSEYNVLVKGNEYIIIDMGQGVLLTHPKAKDFFERDCKNIANFFSKKGMKKTPQDVYDEVKKLAKT